MKSIQNWLSSIRGKSSTGSSNSSAPLRRRSRRDTEAQRTRVFFLSMAAVAALIVVILGGGALYEYVFKPNAVLAEVNGHEISRRDYWKYQSVVLYRQARTYESFAMQTTGQQQQQFMQFAAAFDAQRQNIWGSTDVSNATLQQMIDDRLYLDGASAMGIDITDEMVSQFALNEFAPPDAPLQTPIPSPTLIPERAAMATETAAALATEQALDFGTPVDTAPIATPAATPVVGATPIASPVTDAQPGVATPDLMNSLASANADFMLFKDAVFGLAHMSQDDYIRLWARPQMARQLVDAQLIDSVPQTAEQVDAQHILVATQELAQQLYQQVTGGADFDAIARANSIDTLTAPTGGQLGWFTRLEVDPAFADVAFTLDPGKISEPVQTPFGWHIIKVIARNPDRALSASQYQLAVDHATSSWLDDQRAQAAISNDHGAVTPTPTQGSFVPPPDAPTMVPPTPIPVTPTPTEPFIGPEPVTPGAIEEATPVATPVVSTPIANATPIASPSVATPVASPIVATPEASPAAA